LEKPAYFTFRATAPNYITPNDVTSTKTVILISQNTGSVHSSPHNHKTLFINCHFYFVLHNEPCN
jgi:hypothetical protein